MSVTRERIEELRRFQSSYGISSECDDLADAFNELFTAYDELKAQLDQPAPELEVVAWEIRYQLPDGSIESELSKYLAGDLLESDPNVSALCLVSTATQAVEAERKRADKLERDNSDLAFLVKSCMELSAADIEALPQYQNVKELFDSIDNEPDARDKTIAALRTELADLKRIAGEHVELLHQATWRISDSDPTKKKIVEALDHEKARELRKAHFASAVAKGGENG